MADPTLEAELVDIIRMATGDLPVLQDNVEQATRDFARRSEDREKLFKGGLYAETGELWDDVCDGFDKVLAQTAERLDDMAQALTLVVTNYVAADQFVLQRLPNLGPLLP